MKKIVFILCMAILVSGTNYAQMAPLSAESVLQGAVSKAAAGNKNVLLMFHASWCGWCKKMDASLEDAVCKSFFDKYYVIEHLTVMESKDKVDQENPGGMEYLKKYSGETAGLPYWVILDKKGDLLFDSRMKEATGKLQNTGCPASEPEVNYFVDLLRKTSGLSKEQLVIIAARFRKNESN